MNREVDILKRLSCTEGFVQLLDVFIQHDRQLVVMELCNGGTVMDMVVEYGPLKERKANTLFRRKSMAC